MGSDAWVAELEEDLEAKVAREKADYEAAVAAGPAVPADAPEVAAALDMQMVLVHGDTLIATSERDGWEGSLAKFKTFIAETFAK